MLGNFALFLSLTPRFSGVVRGAEAIPNRFNGFPQRIGEIVGEYQLIKPLKRLGVAWSCFPPR